jgi:hypothetical protein
MILWMLFSGQQQLPPTPFLSIQHESFYFGEVNPGVCYFHEFKMGNIGNSPLLVQEVLSDSGCKTIDFDQKILPGTDGRIIVSLEPNTFQDSPKKSIATVLIEPGNRLTWNELH